MHTRLRIIEVKTLIQLPKPFSPAFHIFAMFQTPARQAETFQIASGGIWEEQAQQQHEPSWDND
jgi:hypothetical protein